MDQKNPCRVERNMSLDEFAALRFSGLTSDEQETSLHWMRGDTEIVVCTSDNTTLTKLQHIAKNSPEAIEVRAVSYLDDSPVDCIAVINKKLVTLRSSLVTREVSEEQREALSERMKRLRSIIDADVETPGDM